MTVLFLISAGPVDPHPEDALPELPDDALLRHLRPGRHELRREHRVEPGGECAIRVYIV